jgi:penicillin-binding protein 1C
VNRIGMSRAVYTREGSLLRLSLSDDDHLRLWTPLDKIPSVVVDATLLAEDRFFFWHPGVNPLSLLRAVRHTYLAGDRRMGGSTLTMQVARLRFDLRTHTWRGKVAQILRALELELLYPKREILEAYLNLAPYGGNIEGVGAASLVWLGKPVEKLTPADALTLAVIPKNPAARAPYTETGRQEILAASARLARRWGARHPEARPANLATVHLHDRGDLAFRAPHLADRMLAEHPDISSLETTLDPQLQAIVENQVEAAMGRGRRFGIRNAAVLLVDYRTMEVLAYVGSADHADVTIQGAVDGVRARRSPGSALKPFLYALALDAGLIHPQSMLEDTSVTISSWNPENFDHEFLGPLSATDALVRSRNLPAVQLANRLPPPGLHGFLEEAQIGGLRDADFYGLAIALGGVEVRLDELVRLYALLANSGRLRDLVFLRGAKRPSPADTPALLSPEASFLVLDMLRSNPRPDEDLNAAEGLRRRGVPWKTGTSFSFRDAWAVGVFGRFVLGVWVGNFDGASNPAFVGREAAGPIFFSVVDALQAAGESAEPPSMRPRLSLVHASVCAVSGEIPGAFCPGLKETWFIPGRSPITPCSIHREVAIDIHTGLRACPGQIDGVRHEVYEFWPSHLSALFRRVGIGRRTPPPFAPGCTERPVAGLPLHIESPQPHLVYALRDGKEDEIPFSAIADADGRRVSWFVDDAFVGQSEPGGMLFWHARPGHFVVRAVDELGRSRTESLDVMLVGDGRPPPR